MLILVMLLIILMRAPLSFAGLEEGHALSLLLLILLTDRLLMCIWCVCIVLLVLHVVIVIISLIIVMCYLLLATICLWVIVTIRY